MSKYILDFKILKLSTKVPICVSLTTWVPNPIKMCSVYFMLVLKPHSVLIFQTIRALKTSVNLHCKSLLIRSCLLLGDRDGRHVRGYYGRRGRPHRLRHHDHGLQYSHFDGSGLFPHVPMCRCERR